MFNEKVLLVDGDILLYQTTFANEEEINWYDDVWCLHTNLAKAKDQFARLMQSFLAEPYYATEVVVCMTDPKDNFRKRLYPDYKAPRGDSRKPMGWTPMREWIMDEANAEDWSVGEDGEPWWYPKMKPGIEGDDVIGILATHPEMMDVEVEIFSLDKDLLTIPGAHWIMTEEKVHELEFISQDEADRHFYSQTLTGDTTDNYKGCPGVGASTAWKYLTEGKKLTPREHTLQRGPRKGQKEIRWEEARSGSYWETVLSFYQREGLSGHCPVFLQARGPD